MLPSCLLSAALVALALASPTPKYNNSGRSKSSLERIEPSGYTSTTVRDTVAKRSDREIKLLDGTSLVVSTVVEAESYENSALRNGTSPTVSDGEDEESSLSQQVSTQGVKTISSCGPKSGWTPVEDHGSYQDLAMWGYRSAVEAFCSRAAFGLNVDGTATPVVVGAGKRISYTVRWENDKANINNELRGHRVGLKGDKPGYIEFEVNNKMTKEDYTMTEDVCKTNLLRLAGPVADKDCFGRLGDTKGGTWQSDDGKITFHALPAVG